MNNTNHYIDNPKPLNEFEQHDFLKPIVESKQFSNKKTEFKMVLIILSSIIKDGWQPTIHLPQLQLLFRFQYHQPYDFAKILFLKTKSSIINVSKNETVIKEEYPDNPNNRETSKNTSPNNNMSPNTKMSNSASKNDQNNMNENKSLNDAKIEEEDDDDENDCISFNDEEINNNHVQEDQNVKVEEKYSNNSPKFTNQDSKPKSKSITIKRPQKIDKININHKNDDEDDVDKMDDDTINAINNYQYESINQTNNVMNEYQSDEHSNENSNENDDYRPSNIKKTKRGPRKLKSKPPTRLKDVTQQYEDDKASVHSDQSNSAKKRVQKSNIRTVDADRLNQMSNVDKRDLQGMDDMELFAIIDSNFIRTINLDEECVDFPRIAQEDGKVILNWQSEIFGFTLNLIRPQNSKDFVVCKYQVIHKALERLLKADCLNVTEDEIEEALKDLRNKYSLEGFSLDTAPGRGIRNEDINLDFFTNADYNINSFTKLPQIGVNFEKKTINFNYKNVKKNLGLALNRKFNEETFQHTQFSTILKAYEQLLENNVFDIDLNLFKEFINSKINELEPLPNGQAPVEPKSKSKKHLISKEMLCELDVSDKNVKIPQIYKINKEHKQLFRYVSAKLNVKINRVQKQDNRTRISVLLDVISEGYSECIKHCLFQNLTQVELEESIAFLREKYEDTITLLPAKLESQANEDMDENENISIADEESARETLSLKDDQEDAVSQKEEDDVQMDDTEAEKKYKHNYKPYHNNHNNHNNGIFHTSKLGLINKELFYNLVFEPSQFKLPQITIHKNICTFNYKNDKQNIKKSFNKKFNEDNFPSVALYIIERGQEMLTSENLLPRLNSAEFEQIMEEFKTKYNQEETDVHRSTTSKTQDIITREWLMEIDLNSSEDTLPQVSQKEDKVCFVFKKDEKKFSVSRKWGTDCTFPQAKLGVFFRGYKWMIDNKLITNLNIQELSTSINELFKIHNLRM